MHIEKHIGRCNITQSVSLRAMPLDWTEALGAVSDIPPGVINSVAHIVVPGSRDAEVRQNRDEAIPMHTRLLVVVTKHRSPSIEEERVVDGTIILFFCI